MAGSPPRRTSQSNANAPMPEDPVESVVVWLRREWTDGCHGGMPFLTARSLAERLRPVAASIEAGQAVAGVLDRMDAYRALPAADRRPELERIAADVKALRPLLAAAEEAAPPLGTLERAVDPARAAAKATAVPPAPAASPARVAPPPPPLALDAPVTELPRVGEQVAKKLRKLQIETVRDVLRHAPRRHIDYRNVVRIGQALFEPGVPVTVAGRVVDIQLHRGPGTPRVVAKLADGSGWIKVVWFNQYLANQIWPGDEIAVSGEPEFGYGAIQFTGPEWEHISGPRATGLNTGRLTPVYPLTAGVHQKTLRPLTRAALDRSRSAIPEILPDALLRSLGLPSIEEAYEWLHYPPTQAENDAARRRLGFDDLFLLTLGQLVNRRSRETAPALPLPVDAAFLDAFLPALPFALTGDQRRALDDILRDLALDRPMARLVQGDVGSGKTVVAAGAMAAARVNGGQSAMMAPTQILAEQHARGLEQLFANMPSAIRPRLALLTGNTPARERKPILAGLAGGVIDVVVGTSAVIQDKVVFSRLALSVVDEQHRFGVRQRASLPDRASGAVPHQLALTATPIPRTLSMILHGDLEVSIIRERPPGRTPVETRRYVGAQRDEAYRLVREQVALGRQVFVICPLVEASEAIEAKAAVEEAARLQEEVFPDLRIAVLHGRMSGREKDEVMTAFRDGLHDVLVSTSVIEGGIDVPNATVMLVEGADRFGLAQLHQFRGGVGRGAARSWCLLLADEATPEGEERLAMMCSTDDGFALAEKDLELRGPGDFLGTRQSGLPEMSWSFDQALAEPARVAAREVLDRDPDLSRPEHAALAAALEAFWATRTGAQV
ncbi:MAG: ATP-dependent DNA helicase RecG [Chloroflexota bacterium]